VVFSCYLKALTKGEFFKMKNTTLLFLLGMLTMAFALLVAGCGNVVDDGFYDKATLADKLESLTPNTAQDPYTIVLNSSVSINMEAVAAREAWAAINSTIESKEKFVVLDLRRCAASETISGNFGSIRRGDYVNGRHVVPVLGGNTINT
jgi:hypothetical protein